MVENQQWEFTFCFLG